MPAHLWQEISRGQLWRRWRGRLAMTPASLLTFLVVFVVPGDPVAVLAPQGAPPETRQAIRRELGLDRPVVVQYLAYLGRAVDHALE